MTYQVRLLPRARKEILDAFAWYEHHKTGLGEQFMEVVSEKINQVARAPERWPLRTARYREAIVPVFPFLIIYRIQKGAKMVIISSIFHTARNPRRKPGG